MDGNIPNMPDSTNINPGLDNLNSAESSLNTEQIDNPDLSTPEPEGKESDSTLDKDQTFEDIDEEDYFDEEYYDDENFEDIDEEYYDDEPSEEELEEQEQAYKRARNHRTNKKVAKVATKAAVNYFTGGAGGKIVDMVAKTSEGSQILDKGAEALSNVTESLPDGENIQGMLNEADDAGLIDMADKALDLTGGSPDSAASSDGALEKDMPGLDSLGNAAEKVSSPLGSNSNILIMAAISLLFLIILIAVILEPLNILKLTDGDRAQAAKATTSIILTNEQIENNLIYLGDFRLTELSSALTNQNIRYINAENQGYNWYVENGKDLLYSYISADLNKHVVISLGFNDLDKASHYINVYNSLISSYKNVKFYFQSVNPVNEALAQENGYFITNAKIEEFNNQISSAFGENYIDTYTEIKNDFLATDGVRYDADTNNKIHQKVVSFIKSKNTVSFLSEYPSVSESKILQGQSLESAISSSGVEELEQSILEYVSLGGKCSGVGVAGAAVGLIYGLHQKGYHLPYYYGGGHGINEIINPKWGLDVGNSSITTNGNVYRYGGLDCSGFISWAANAANSSVSGAATSFLGKGPNIPLEAASPGDVLVTPSHIILVIENKGDYLNCAESTVGGVQFKKHEISKLTTKKYQAVDMDEHYKTNCKG